MTLQTVFSLPLCSLTRQGSSHAPYIAHKQKKLRSSSFAAYQPPFSLLKTMGVMSYPPHTISLSERKRMQRNGEQESLDKANKLKMQR
mmetsp:Transcript_47849/g.124189  ORF Transcript_47849/g.124189 Transcript_47849/m.124189 type:complete len:88 (-) Transcript_47849:1126-1389(-)